MRRIKRLSDNVVNRIAAGEVVQRPSAALKELLENALDAGSTFIQVLVRDGGLGLLQVTDDGHGIHRDDLPLLCERYATSKLRSFEDLSRITSFGFRGEALSSISYVSRVTVTTMRRVDKDEASSGTLAWRCQYLDGAMQGEPTPCAGNPGTSIRVEKMFYNSAVRRRALNRPSEEYSRIVALISRYALAFPHVGFSCRREEGTGGKAEIFFPKDSSSLANIRLFHGPAIASHLNELKCVEAGAGSGSPETVLAKRGEAGEDCFLITGYTSGMALLNRNPYLCIFVNNRLVESAVIKRAIDTVYSGILTGGNRPFTVLFITIPPDRVDVNIHPTKHEVCLLDEEIIVAQLSESVRLAVMESAARRQLDTRHVLSKAAALAGDRGAHVSQPSPLPSSIVVAGVAAAPCTVVRVEPQRGALDAYCRRMPISKKEEAGEVSSEDAVDKQRFENCSHPDPLTAVKSGETIIQEEQHAAGTSIVCTASNEDVTASLITSIMKFGSTDAADRDEGEAKKRLKEEEREEGEEEKEDLGYVMQQFKRQRKEIQRAAGIVTTAEAAEDEKVGAGVVYASAASSACESAVEPVPDERGDLLLTSVSTIVSQIRQATSPTVQSLFEKLVYVGVINGHIFLAQSGTTLYAVDTLRLVRLVVYQRIFMRWSIASLPAPPQMLLQEPVRVTDLLYFALQHDVPPKTDVSLAESTQRTVRRMDRCLRQWRCMLLEYFSIEITHDGYLLALPFGLNSSWPPSPRVVPLFIWRLAAEVPYREDEVACFTAIARHIADTLYGLRLHDAWVEPRVSPSPGVEPPGDGRGEEGGSVPSLFDAIRFALLPCATSSKLFVPPADALIDGTIQTVVSVEELYKVFERC
ncbi:putative mismatch repair protein MLH1 [Trypanosoma cruzi]|uniref:Mismatch repair protein MLH1, putative n=2 Tax=Trypanosoma cruzi TaxID=5693 RepID=Q4DI77_TRYCC|nr:mismatch repair protein MLH1, putative [Trypanosoma cruzi]EAN92236.1 mismatch repair protein MLH1, putative [Trypanosoma cruzi]PWV19044.1 putative mismatch repair protein MLH1 [Trypanosoma cruzi]RNC57500.1 mismatch repair protein MLH1 [Trypanosoma cruzi]|eukprot:XP_814087.1 mismatch repair protein MLH1 [Trypanosoma cruzi strain CL Brener]